jgi:hypothetical protein
MLGFIGRGKMFFLGLEKMGMLFPRKLPDDWCLELEFDWENIG